MKFKIINFFIDNPKNQKVKFQISFPQAILAARSRIFYKLLYQQQASPQRKTPQPPPPVRENKLRLFLKRSSEPLLNLQNESQRVNNLFYINFHHN